MKKIFTLLSGALVALSLSAANLTVAEGTVENNKLPVNGYYSDVQENHTQFVYPAADLTDVNGHNVSALTFYAKNTSMSWGSAVFSVKIGEIDENALSGFASATFTEVYSGKLSIASTFLEINFTQNYAYTGKNLLIDISQTAKSSFSDANEPTFYGIEVAGAGYGNKTGQYGMAGVVNFLPQLTITHDGGSAAGTCEKPSKLAGKLTPDGGVFTWEAEEAAVCQWCVVVKDAAATGWASLAAGVTTYTATGLNVGTEYDFCVRVDCGDKQSSETRYTFTPVCNAPSNLQASAVEPNKATLSWEAVAGVSKYQYVCVEKDGEYSWEGVEAKAVLNVTVDTLLENTAYDFYVRSYFNDKVQSEAAKLTFVTDCDVKEMPYREAFMNTTLPDCWAFENVSSYGWKMYTESDPMGSTCMYYSARANLEKVDVLALPAINLSEAAVIKMLVMNAKGLNIKMLVSTDGGATKKELADLSELVAEPKDIQIDLSAYSGEVRLYFQGTSNGKNEYFYFDNFQVVAKPCTTPTELKAEPSSDGALLSWKGSGEAAWNIRYKAVSASEWITVNDLTGVAYTISGLVSGTEYEVQVQAACSAEKQSKWSSSVKFTPACPVPANVVVSEVTENAAVVAWESSESKFNLQYKAAADAEWKEVKDLSAKRYALSDLQASTAYEVQVQAACGGEFSKPVSFTTVCAPIADAIPYIENFESVAGGALPECWVRRSTSEYPAVEITSGARGADEDTKANCLAFRGENEQIAILPAFDKQLNGLTLSFFYKMSANTVTLEVGYLVSLYGAFQQVEVLSNEVFAYEDKAHAVNLKDCPAEAKYVAIRCTSTSAYSNAYIDDLTLETSEEATAIGHVEEASQATKHIVNGQLVIEMNGVRYNAQGAVVR